MAIAHQLAQRDVTLYVVGVEPNVLRYRDFFMVLAHAAGGRYVPLANAQVLAKVSPHSTFLTGYIVVPFLSAVDMLDDVVAA